MASRLGVYQAALTEIGAANLASLAENVESRRVLDAVWDALIVECLEAANWVFATRIAKYDSDPDLDIAFGFTYGFTKDDDWLRTAAVASDDRFLCPLIDKGYEDRGAFWVADVDPIYVKYVSSGDTYGLDLSRWPPSFTRFVVLALAERVSNRLTGTNTSAEVLAYRLKKAKAKACATDAMNGPQPKFPPPGRLVQARRGWGQFARRYDRA